MSTTARRSIRRWPGPRSVAGIDGVTVPVVLTGSNLAGGTVNAIAGVTVTVTSTTATQINATFVIAANAAAGPRNVTVTTGAGTIDLTINEASTREHLRSSPDAFAKVPSRRETLTISPDTFMFDLLRIAGGAPGPRGRPDQRYPKVTLDAVRAFRPSAVLLPDEPYAFGPDDGPEAWPQLRAAFVSGRHLTWYGPSLVEAPSVLLGQLEQ